MSKKYKPSEAMVKNQSRGRALKKRKTARSYTSAYEMTAKSFEEELSLDDVKNVYRFLVKSQEQIDKYNVDHDGTPTEAYLDWLDAGANAGLAWTRKILKSEQILKSYTQDISEEEINREEEDNWDNVTVVKATNEELMQGTFLVLSPEEVDLHGDIYSAEEIRKACHNFNAYCMKANLLHLVETTTFSIVESYISPVDMILGDTVIKAGSWLAVLQFWDDEIWEDVKKGSFTGVSVGCKAQVEYLEDEDA